MNFLSFIIAQRFYTNNTKNYAVLLISMLSKIGISISIFTLIISYSALNGFQELINKNILSSLPHGIITSINQSPFNWKEMIHKINSLPNIVYSEPYFITNSILLNNNNIKFVQVKSFQKIKYLRKYFCSAQNMCNIRQLYNFYINEIIISSDIANDLNAQKGDIINLIFSNKTLGASKEHIKTFSFKIKAIFRSNGFLNSNIALLSFKFFQKHLDINNQITAIELHMLDPLQVNSLVLDMEKKIHIPLFLYTWADNYKNFYHDIKLIKSIIYIILFLLIIISCFSVISISLISISKKTKEIAILRSIGANNFLIQKIFLYYGMRPILLGNIIGLSLGSIVVLNFYNIMFFLEKYFKNNFLLKNIYFKKFLLLELNMWDLIFIFLSTMIIGFIINLYPSCYASSIDPIKVLKKF